MTRFKHRWRAGGPATAREAVSTSVAPGPYSDLGELGEMRHEIERLTDIVGLLAGVLHEQGVLTDRQIVELADMQYEMPEDEQ